MSYSIYLGCIAPLRYPDVEASVRRTFEALEIPIEDMEGANCCPAPATFRMYDDITSLSISARNLDIAEDMGNDVMVICNGCYGGLQPAAHRLNSDSKLLAQVNESLAEAGRKYEGKTNVIHMIEVLYDKFGPEGIKEKTDEALDRGREYLDEKKKALNEAIEAGKVAMAREKEDLTTTPDEDKA